MFIRHLAALDVPGAKEMSLNFIPRAREPYAGSVKTLDFEKVKHLLPIVDPLLSILRRYRAYQSDSRTCIPENH